MLKPRALSEARARAQVRAGEEPDRVWRSCSSLRALVNDLAIYGESTLPDYDVLSPDNVNDAYEMAQLLHRRRLPDVRRALSMFRRCACIGLAAVLDMTYVPPHIFEKVPIEVYQGIVGGVPLPAHRDAQRFRVPVQKRAAGKTRIPLEQGAVAHKPLPRSRRRQW